MTFTDRQIEVLSLIRCGASTEDIADELGISEYVVRDKVRQLRLKLGHGLRMHELPDAAEQAGATLDECGDDVAA